MSKKRRKTKIVNKKVYYPHQDYKLAIRILKLLAKDTLQPTHKIADMLSKSPFTYPQKRVNKTMERLKELDYCEEYNLILGPEHRCNNSEKSRRYFIKNESLENRLKQIEKNKKKGSGLIPKDGYLPARLATPLICYGCSEPADFINPVDFKAPEKFIGPPYFLNNEYKILTERDWSLSQNGELLMLGIIKGQKLYYFIAQHTDNKILELADILIHSQQIEKVKMLVKNLENMMKNIPNLGKIANEWYDYTKNRILRMKIDKTMYPLLAEYQTKLKQDSARKMLRGKQLIAYSSNYISN